MARRFAALTAICTVMLCTAAHADEIAVTQDNSWYQFDVDDFQSASGGLEWITPSGNPLAFTFTAATDVLLTVVDGVYGGDRFEVLDNGHSLGLTSAATNTYPDTHFLDFDAALADSRYSFATFLLTAGEHSVTGLLAESALANGTPLNSTVGAIRVAPVPLPASALLLLSGGGLLGFLRRRNRAALA